MTSKKLKIRCIGKQQDPVTKKNIYLLEDEYGKRITSNADEIKQEIRFGAFDFVNLQIDKAGRLVKKAEDPNQKMQIIDVNEFTVQDLLNMNEVKGKKIRAIDPDRNIVKQLIGQNYCTNPNSNFGIHNSVYAYSEEDGKLYIVNIGSTDGKNNIPVNELMSGNHKVGLVLRHGYTVDLKENPNGRYTVIRIGKYKEEFIDRVYNMRVYKIHDKVEGKDTWVSEGFLESHMDKNSGQNDFTNVCIQMDNIKVLQEEKMKCMDVNYEMRLFNKFISSVENVFKYDIENNCLYISYDEDTYRVSGETIEKLKNAEIIFEEFNKIDLFNINNRKLHDIAMEILRNKISELTEINKKKVYYVGIEDSEIHMSTDKSKIKQIYENYKSDSEFWNCDMDYIMTNLDVE